MEREKKYFGGEGQGFGGNFDDAPMAVKLNEWINAEEVRTLTTDSGETGILESLGANVLIPNPALTSPTAVTIGAAEDEVNSRIIEFTYDVAGSRIDCYDLTANIWYVVLLESQITGGLNWDKNKIIHSARVINGCVYWVNDDQNEPRRINIDAGIKMNGGPSFSDVPAYTIPLDQSNLTIIRRQPGLPPIQVKQTQTTPTVFANLIANSSQQFCYRYGYSQYEISTLSGQSLLADYNADGDTFNCIDVNIPTAEPIDQDVIQIDMVVKFLATNKFFVIKSWKKSNPTDLAEINAHNAGTTPLTFRFYNDQIGVPLDDAYSVKLFDSVPLTAEALETAKNRLFLGNYKIGYDTPISTSLSLSSTSQTFSGSSSDIIGNWFLLKYHTTAPDASGSAYVLFTTTNFGGNPPTGQYWYTWTGGSVPPFPPSVNATDLVYRGSTFSQMVNSFRGSAIAIAPTDYINQSAASIIISSATPVSSVVGTAFKSNASYQVSISFKDNYGRECGILTNPSLLFTTPDTGLSAYTYITAITWLLSNANALNEIPDWAYYYSINITQCLRTRFFLQSLGVFIYADKDTSGDYTFTTTAYSSDLAGIAIDLTFLNSHAQGYSFSEGDLVEAYIHGTLYNLSIIGESGKWIICQLMDVGSLATTEGIYEIYTPYKRQSNEPYFEENNIFPVLNPGTNSRQYSALTGSIVGDVFIFSRTNSTTNYFTEGMSPNDKFYFPWFTSAGRPNFIDDIGQVTKTGSIAFSNTFILGSKNNGLSTFDALDTKDIYPECGPLKKLQLTSKVEGEIGTIMLGICVKDTTSLYMGETQVLSTTGDAFLAQASGVIGTINVLKGNFGTISPESVVEFRGNVFWVDVLNGKVIQYSANGLFPISNYKMTRYWKLFCAQYASMSQSVIEALGSRPFIFSCVDSNNWELLISVPKVLATPPKGYLPDYPDMIYPFDIWDGQGKTLVYKLNAQPNHWQGVYRFSPEWLTGMQNKVFSFKAGKIYEHNSNVFPCTYYGEAKTPKIMFLGNQIPNRPKVYNNVSIEGNYRPTLVYFRTEPSLDEFEQYDLEEQASDLTDFDFEIKEGQMYAAMYRNKLQPTATGMDFNGLLTGNKMRALALKTMLQFNPTKGPLQLRFFTFGFSISLGHTT